MTQRIGRIQVQRSELYRNVHDANSHLYQLFANFIPIETRVNRELDVIEYVGISNQFDQVEEGQIIPEYHVIFENQIHKIIGLCNTMQTTFQGFRKADKELK